MLRLKRFDGVPNFGDNLNDYILKRLVDTEIVYTKDSTEKNYLLFIGSYLHEATSEAIVWGSGIISPRHLPKSQPRQISCVRGPLSRMVLVDNNFLKRDDQISLGDPAMLLKFTGCKNDCISKEFDIGFIPHYADHLIFNMCTMKPPKTFLNLGIKKRNYYSGDLIRTVEFQEKTSIVIDVRNSCDDVIKDMQKCRIIVSSSLHGLIVADMLNIPNVWIRFGENLTGGSFKFVDYMLSVERTDVEPVFVLGKIENQQIDQILERAEYWKYSFNFEDYMIKFTRFINETSRYFMD